MPALSVVHEESPVSSGAPSPLSSSYTADARPRSASRTKKAVGSLKGRVAAVRGKAPLNAIVEGAVDPERRLSFSYFGNKPMGRPKKSMVMMDNPLAAAAAAASAAKSPAAAAAAFAAVGRGKVPPPPAEKEGLTGRLGAMLGIKKPAQAPAPGSGLSAPGFMPATTNPLAAIARAGRTGVALTPSEALAFAKSGGPRLTRASSKKGFVGGDEPSDSEASAPPS